MTLRSNWPTVGQLTEAHHDDAREAWVADWAVRKAQSFAARTHSDLDADTFTEYCELLASHFADDSASRRHFAGVCITAGCDYPAEGDYSLRCWMHQPTSEVNDALPKPYGMDDTHSVSCYADWLGYVSDEGTDAYSYETRERVTYRLRDPRTGRMTHAHYTVSETKFVSERLDWSDDSTTYGR